MVMVMHSNTLSLRAFAARNLLDVVFLMDPLVLQVVDKFRNIIWYVLSTRTYGPFLGEKRKNYKVVP